MQYRLRTLLILLAIGPPLIGLWPSITKRAVLRATQITASDVVVATAAAALIAMRVRISRTEQAPFAETPESKELST